MEQLSKKYLDRLSKIREDIQESEILQKYLEEEEDSIFKELAETFEPQIDQLYEEVADSHPLQLISFENHLLNPGFEGLYLPRILGYSVLRGEVTSQFKYKKPQHHFKDILLTICNSANFDILRQRIGQSVQVGFALSSDIWITNLLNLINNRFVLAFLESLRLEIYRDIRSRHTAYVKYKKQFEHFNFQSAPFPVNIQELKLYANRLKSFLLYRAVHGFKNESLLNYIREFLSKSEFVGHLEFTELIMVISMYYDLNKKDAKIGSEQFDASRSADQEFHIKYFDLLVSLMEDPGIKIGSQQDQRISALINKDIPDEISKYYNLMDKLHSLGFVHEDSIEVIRTYYDQHKGLSIQNECVRLAIYNYFSTILLNLEETAYQDYFEMNKIFTQYMNIFSNEKFNQKVKTLSLNYVKKLLKYFTDKRAKDYQDIKKFVSTTFLDLGFLKQKEITELFKTRRKKKEGG